MKNRLIPFYVAFFLVQTSIGVLNERDIWSRDVSPEEHAWVTLSQENVDLFNSVKYPIGRRPALAEMKKLVCEGARVFLRGMYQQALKEAHDYFKTGKQPSRVTEVVESYKEDFSESRGFSYPTPVEQHDIEPTVKNHLERRTIGTRGAENGHCLDSDTVYVKKDMHVGGNMKIRKALSVGGPLRLHAYGKQCAPIFAQGTDECGGVYMRAGVRFRTSPQLSLFLGGTGVVRGLLPLEIQFRCRELYAKVGNIEVGNAKVTVEGYAESTGSSLMQTVQVSVFFPVSFCVPFIAEETVLASFENCSGKTLSSLTDDDHLIFSSPPVITLEKSSRAGVVIRMTLPFISFFADDSADAAQTQRTAIARIGLKASEIMRSTCINLLSQGV